jgi:hypothetical protein
MMFREQRKLKLTTCCWYKEIDIGLMRVIKHKEA